MNYPMKLRICLKVLTIGRIGVIIKVEVRNMYVYIESEHNLWTVGFYDPKGNWHPDSDHDNREEAAKRVAWLNGSV